MHRLVNTETAASRQRDAGHPAKGLLMDRLTVNARLGHLLDECIDVITHQIELVDIVLVGRMHGHFRRQQTKDQPTAADIDVWQTDHIAEKCAVGFRIVAVDDRVSANDQTKGDRPRLPPLPRKSVVCPLFMRVVRRGTHR